MLTKMISRRPVGGLDHPSMLMMLVLMMITIVALAADSRTLKGDYCRLRPGAERRKCCGGRLDECSVPILDTLCYCDEFCDRDENDDCCPDYWTFCKGQPEPPTIPPQPILSCFYNGNYYQVGQAIRFNCNQCTCRALSPTNAEMVCEERRCIIRPDIIQTINHGNYGWRAGNYSFFWGKSLDEGYEKRLGVCKPESSVMDQSSLRLVMNGEAIDVEFDSRRKWPGWIQPIHDQGDFPASWAVSTVDLAADRLAIQSHGEEGMTLSAQNLISCVANRKLNHCNTGSMDRAWWHINLFGVVSDQCYPYTSGTTGTKGSCRIERSARAKMSFCPSGRHTSVVYRTPPAYRVSEKEEEIMMEIKTNGPVQAIFRVKDDFFIYKSGVYRHTRVGNQRDHHHRHPFHAVRIIGWGVDRSHGAPTNYWLCANSWGTDWGENGYFRIVRGQNECDIEMFVVGAWAGTQNVHENLVSNTI